MNFDIQSQGFELTDSLRDYAERRLVFGLGRSAHNVSRVAVLLADINGSRGGIDKRCRIRVRLEPSLEVVVEDTQANLFLAIDRAADRAGRAVARSMRRQQRARFLARTLQHGALESSVVA